MKNPFPVLLTIAALAAIAMSIAPADAKSKRKTTRQVKYCNELPYNRCVKCAIARGYSPGQYGPYCSTRR